MAKVWKAFPHAAIRRASRSKEQKHDDQSMDLVLANCTNSMKGLIAPYQSCH